MSQEQIAKLESLLERIRRNASAARVPTVHVAATDEVLAAAQPTPTVPPSADARVVLEQERVPEEVEVEVEVEVAPAAVVEPLESRSRLVAAGPAEPEELAEEVLELDERHIVREVEEPAVVVVEEEEAAVALEAQVPVPPPSSRRPIAEPMEAPVPEMEMAQPPPMTPPPESGKQVAALADFEDDFTGVREAKKQEAPAPEEEPIALASVRTAEAKAPLEMEAELPPAKAPGEYTAELVASTRTGTVPSMAAAVAPAPIAPEVTQAPAATATSVARMEGAVPAFAPKTFGELLDATLAL